METSSATAGRRRLQTALLCGAAFGLLAASGARGQKHVGEIRAMLEHDAEKMLAATEGGGLTAFDRACLEAADDAVPALSKSLRDRRDPDRRGLAAYGLALIGGERARDALRSEWKRTKDFGIERLLCAAMASTGSRGDIDFLIRALRGPRIGEGWPVVESAALSLGVLRASSAAPMLQACAEDGAGTVAGQACRTSLGWLRGESSPEEPRTAASPRDRVIAAVFACGIPRVENTSRLYEWKQNHVWRRRGKAWETETESPKEPAQIPTIDFDVYVNADASRAIAAVSLVFGRLDARGYTFILRRAGASWRVTGILSTWIS
jgi:hypothetical protein